MFYVFILLYDCLFSSLFIYSFFCIIVFIYIYSFIFLFIYLLSLYFTFIRYWFWCFVWFVSLLQVGFGPCCLFPFVSFFRSFFLFWEVGRSGSMLLGMAFWLLPVPSVPFPCLGTFVQSFLLRVFRVVLYLSCIQTAVVYMVWCFTVDPLFCRIPAASLRQRVWCLPVEWGAMALLQDLP